MGENPVADGSQFTIDVAWHSLMKTENTDHLKRIIDSLVKTLEAVPRNPDTHLVHIIPGEVQERCPYGFTDTVGKQGDVLFCSDELNRQGTEKHVIGERTVRTTHQTVSSKRLCQQGPHESQKMRTLSGGK